jgi:hypothetical protein
MTETSSASGSSMNTSTTDQARLVIVGATGMVGGYALRYVLEHAAVGTVTAIGRRRLGISHAKLREVLHQDFADCSALAAPLSGQDAAIFCLGTYTGAVSDAELRKTTVDYTIEFARVLRLNGPGAAFSFLSGVAPTRRDEVALPTRDIRVRPKMHYSQRVFPTFISSDRRISTRWTTEGTEFQLPAYARDLPGVSGALPEPGDSGRRLGPSDGRCCRAEKWRAWELGF